MAALRKPARVVSQSLLRLQSDTRLAQLARDGHEPAFDALVQRYRTELVRASSRIVGPDRSEDAVQQALLNAHRAINTTENVQNLRAWLHKIGHNSSLNTLRALRDEVPIDEQRSVASGAPGPPEAAELSERLRETLAAINGLPENQRAALLLRELEGRSHDDIATALGLSTGAARQQLLRARQGVRQAVTALTPYPLVAALSASGTHATVAELVFGAGASATAVKLGASVAATGAIAGGIFGASVAVQPHQSNADGDRKDKVTRTTSVAAVTPPAQTSARNLVIGDSRSEGRDSRGHSANDDHPDHRGRGDREHSGSDRRSGRHDGSRREHRQAESGRDRGSKRSGESRSGGIVSKNSGADGSASSGSNADSGDPSRSGGSGSGNSGRGGDD